MRVVTNLCLQYSTRKSNKIMLYYPLNIDIPISMQVTFFRKNSYLSWRITFLHILKVGGREIRKKKHANFPRELCKKSVTLKQKGKRM